MAPGYAPAGSERVAAVDLGTNSLRLLVVEQDVDGPLRPPHELVRRTELTGVGRGVDRTGSIHPDAIRRALAIAQDFAVQLRDLGVTHVVVAATSAARDAANAEQLLSGLARVLGTRPTIISGDTEAELSFRGATTGAGPSTSGVLVVDPGGGSTELALSTRTGLVVHSLPVGAVRQSDRHRRGPDHEPLPQSAVDAIRADVRSELEACPVPLVRVRRVVGVAATALTVTAHATRATSIDGPDVERSIPLGEVVRACDELAAMSPEALGRLPYLRAGREDVIAAGAIIWSEVLHAVACGSPDLAEVRTTRHDLLDGLAASVLT